MNKTVANSIFVVGCGRNGTSMVAGLFRNSGHYMGDRLHAPRESNPKGFFEDATINQLNDRILARYTPSPEEKFRQPCAHGADTPGDRQRWLARISPAVRIDATTEEHAAIASLVARRPFCFKDTRFCYTLDSWLQHAADARSICVFREPGAAIASILKEVHSQPYLADLAISTRQAYELWELMYRRVLDQLSRQGEWLFVNYDDVVSGRANEAIRAFSGVDIDRGFATRELDRSSSSRAGEVPAQVLELYRELDVRAKSALGAAPPVTAPPATSPQAVAFGCTIDRDPRFPEQAIRLLLSLRNFGGTLATADFYVCCVDALPPERLVAAFEALGAKLRLVPRMHLKHGPSNKLRFLELPELANYTHVVMLDCDTVIVADPSPLIVDGAFAAKIADFPTITDPEFANLFRHFGLEKPACSCTTTHESTPTIPYFNAGVCSIPGALLPRFRSAWIAWNDRILAAGLDHLFTPFYTDQASLTLAITSENIPYRELPAAANYPGHVPTETPGADTTPWIIHYHGNVTADGLLGSMPSPVAQARAEAFNDLLKGIARGGSRVAARAGGHPKIIVGSGWWCNETPSDWNIGDGSTRTRAFFRQWLEQVETCLAPERIHITDSASPLKPAERTHPGITWTELDRNYGHANDIRTGRVDAKYCGFTLSVFLGAAYALACNADYYVYVEQDCLIFGDDFLQRAIADHPEQILVGRPTENGVGLNGGVAAPMIQQSLMVVPKARLLEFMNGLLAGEQSDGEVSPEIKMKRFMPNLGFLGIPFGRSRPIDFSAPAFYAQHLTLDELERFQRLKDTNSSENSGGVTSLT